MKTRKDKYPINLYFSRQNESILKVIRNYNKPFKVDDIQYITKGQADKLIKEAKEEGFKEGYQHGINVGNREND